MSKLRKCTVKDRKGYFHCWEHYAQVIEPSLMIGGGSGGQLSCVFGIVEFEDGAVNRVEPYNIRFEEYIMNKPKWKHILCDECGNEIENAQDLVQEKAIATDPEKGDIKEQYFECPFCQAHYTIIVTDKEVREKIKQRQTLGKRTKRAFQRKAPECVFAQIQKEDDALKQLINQKAGELREKYL